MSALPTDSRNLAEVNQFHLGRACIFYDELIDLGNSAQYARTQALAYLRRKTHWDEAIAAGALDFELGTRCTHEML